MPSDRHHDDTLDAAAALQAVTDEFRAALPARIDAFRQSLDALRIAPTEDAARAVRAEAHKLRGAAGTYGFARVSEAAASIEEQLDALLHEGMTQVTSESWTRVEVAVGRMLDGLTQTEGSIHRVETPPTVPIARPTPETRSEQVFQSARDAPAPGELLAGQYEVRRVLGEGGMGAVVEAFDLGLRRLVAVKTALHPALDGKLEQEGRALAAIAHDGLPAVYALGHEQGRVFVVMERVRGLSLGRHLAERSQREAHYGVDEVIALLLRLTRVLAVVHEAGLAHRDIKPDNIMLTGERVVLVDFGLATPEYDHGVDRGLEGSPAYMAPEVIEQRVGRGEAFFADIYAMGIVAYELLTFDVPFAGDSISLVLYAHVARLPPDVRETRPDVPAELAELIARMLAKGPLERPTVSEIRWSLLQLQARLADVREDRVPILVVDDDVTMLPLMRAVVLRHAPGARVECVSDPVVAAQRLAKERYALVLMDLEMPTMSGLELLMYLRGGAAGELPDVVVVSADPDAVEPALLRSLGVVATVAKGSAFQERLGSIITRFIRA